MASDDSSSKPLAEEQLLYVLTAYADGRYSTYYKEKPFEPESKCGVDVSEPCRYCLINKSAASIKIESTNTHVRKSKTKKLPMIS